MKRLSYKYRLLLFLLLFLTFRLSAQNTKIDSLNYLISKAKTDTDVILLNLQKIDIIGRSNLDTAIQLSMEQLQNAEKIHYYKGIVMSHNKLANFNIFKGDSSAAKENIRLLEKSIKPKDSISFSLIYSTTGMMYGVQAKYDSSIFFYNKAILLNERLHNDKELPANYANIAIGYQQLANFPMALKYQQKSLLLAQKLSDQNLEAKTYLNMGLTYSNIGDTVKAFESLLKANDLAKKLHSKIIELYTYTNLAGLYLGKKQYDQAYDVSIKAADMAGKAGDIGIKAASLSKAALSLAHQNKFTEAEKLSKQAISIADSSTQSLNISQANNAMGFTLFQQKRYKEATPYFEKNISALGGAANYDYGIGEAYKYLSVCYEKTGNYEKALTAFRKGTDITDSITKKDNIRKATEVSMNFDFEKQQEVQKAEQVLKDKIAHSKQIALIAGLIILFLLAIVAFVGFKNKQKAMRLLKKQKEEIETTFNKLKSTQTQLIQSEKMASLGELTAGIAHEIQNPLNFVNNFSELNMELLAEMREGILNKTYDETQLIAKDVQENEGKINFHGKRAGAIVKGMLQHSRNSTGQKEPVNINALCDEYFRLSLNGIRVKDMSFSATMPIATRTDFDESIGQINIVPQDIGRVLLNLFNNAFYAVNERLKVPPDSHYQPFVFLGTKKITDQSGVQWVDIIVRDNGAGIPENVIGKIFQPFYTTKPTGDGTGLGLSISYDIVKVHGGEIRVKNLEEGGAEFILELPVG